MRIPTYNHAAKAAMALAMAAAVATLPTSAQAAAPTAGADTASTTPGAEKTIPVLANDTNPDTGEALVITDNTDPSHGAVTCDDSSCTYTPTTGWTGADTFTYTIADGAGGLETAIGEVTVTTVAVSSITVASTPSAVVTWPNAITAETPVPTARLVGTVKQSGGTPIVGVEAELLHKPTGATEYTHLAGPLTTNDNGKVSVDGLVLTSATTYKWKVGSKLSPLALVGVAPSLTTDYSTKKLAADDTTPLTISGVTGPATEGAAVDLERRNSDGTWSVAATTLLGEPDEDGYAEYSFTRPADASGKYVYRVTVPKANGRNEVNSGQTTVKRYDAEISSVDPKDADEIVVVKNTGAVAVNLSGWTLTQGIREAVLPSWTVGVGDIVRIHSGKGRNTAKDLYLKGVDRWTTSGTITLADKKGFVLHEYNYPVLP